GAQHLDDGLDVRLVDPLAAVRQHCRSHRRARLDRRRGRLSPHACWSASALSCSVESQSVLLSLVYWNPSSSALPSAHLSTPHQGCTGGTTYMSSSSRATRASSSDTSTSWSFSPDLMPICRTLQPGAIASARSTTLILG